MTLKILTGEAHERERQLREKHYRYRLEGTGGGGATWTTEGTVRCEWPDLFGVVNREAFRKLTNGNATYGNPGQGGCRGPYEITSFEVSLVLQ